MNEAEEEKLLFGVPKNTGIDFSTYNRIDVNVNPGGIPVPEPAATFADMKFHESLLGNIARMGYKDPTPIQKYAVPIGLGGRDMMSCAQTGSGKTGAFMWIIIVQLMRAKSGQGYVAPNRADPEAVVMTPTRELAIQIQREAEKFTYKLPLVSNIAYGGQPRNLQLQKISRGTDILIATPGRLKDFLDNHNFSVKRCKVLVLDEADRMLDMGFEPQIRQIIENLGMPQSQNRQTLMFSATFAQEIQRLAGRYLNQPAMISVGRVGSTTDLITQQFMIVDNFDKLGALNYLLTEHKTAKRILVFVERKTTAYSIDRHLEENGFYSTSIHGDRTQVEREKALNDFARGALKIMVATDVASRGLDIDGIDLVINFDTPNEIDSYTHRIGRTGRCGRKGLAVSFINSSTNQRCLGQIRDQLQEVEQTSVDLDQLLNQLSRNGGFGGGGPRGGGRGRY